jgi:hypothetical protein
MNKKEVKRRVKRFIWPQYLVEPQSAEAPMGNAGQINPVFGLDGAGN